MPEHALPILLLDHGAPAPLRARSEASIARQSVETVTCQSTAALAACPHEYAVLLVAGTELDATACERAVWFLATHPSVAFVSGAARLPATDAPEFACVQQFMVTRHEVVRSLPATHESPPIATAIALAISIRAQTGRGAGWVAEPVIAGHTDATVLAAVETSARAALQHRQLDPGALVAHDTNDIPGAPYQSLQQTAAPALQVRRGPTTGRRVLVLVQGFPMGGYTAFNADLLPRIAARGHAITTCTTEIWRTDWRLDLVRASSPDIHHAHAVVPGRVVPTYIDWLITSRGIDVVLLSHSYLGYHLLPWLRVRHPGVAFVDYVHTDWFEQSMYGSYAAMAARWATQLDAQLATSHALVTQLVADGCEPDAVRAAHIGIDTAVWKHATARLADVRQAVGAGPATLLLVFAGRVSPEKRPHLAIDVTAQLCAEGHDVRLLVVGGGPLLGACVDRARTRGIESRVHVLGELDEPTLRHIYAAADVFIAPSEIEGIARVLYEAMAMGCVPVVSDVGGQRELVVAGTGALVDASRDDAEPYVAGVRPYLDASVRAVASEAARAHVAGQFDVTRTVQAVCETIALAHTRRVQRQAHLPPPMAEELAVMGLDVIRRHVIQATTRQILTPRAT